VVGLAAMVVVSSGAGVSASMGSGLAAVGCSSISDGGTAADPLRKSTQHNTIELMAVVV
jgi:hypothetical protein